ncbi:MAG: hypothetical protein ACI9O3_000729 [Colwellia sp.]|jgi:hypothetical protein
MRMFYVEPNSFTLDIMGECQFSAKGKRQLSASSRIGFWGCWLVFEDNLPAPVTLLKNHFFKTCLAKLNLPSFFIFKTSLSAKHYSRLCRVIVKLNNPN